MSGYSLDKLQEAYWRLHQDYDYLEEVNQTLHSQIREQKIQLWRSMLENEQLHSQLLQMEKEQRG